MKGEGITFMETILAEGEAAESKLNRELIDLVLIEIRELQNQVEQNFDQAEREITIINGWSIKTNDKLVNRIKFLEKKLEAWLKEEGKKTVDLPNGVIRFRKQPDRIEIIDEEMFLNNATSDMLSIIPETAKPDVNKIKAYINRSGRTPKGCEIIQGILKFSYKISNHKETELDGTKETGTGDKQVRKLSVVV